MRCFTALRFVLLLALGPSTSTAGVPPFRVPVELQFIEGTLEFADAADLDDDGRIDLAIGVGNSVRILRGTGTGSFDPGVEFTFGRIREVRFEQADLDLYEDLLVVDGNTLSVFYGLGDATFGRRDDFGFDLLMSAAFGDVNGDSLPDLIGAEYNGNQERIGIRMALPQGGFAATRDIGPGGRYIETGDANGDGRLDIVSLTITSAELLINEGGGSWRTRSHRVGSDPRRVVFSDLDQDRKDDLVVANLISNSITVILDPSSTIGRRTDYEGVDYPSQLAVADLNADGMLDVVVAGVHESRHSLFFGRGDGTLVPAPFISGYFPTRGLFASDLDTDGNQDLVLPCADAIAVMKGNGDGSFGPRSVRLRAVPAGVVLTDFDGDARLDLVAAIARYPDGSAANFVSLHHGFGDGTFDIAREIEVGYEPVALAATDLDRDGAKDLVVANRASSTITVLRGNGRGGFTQHAWSATGVHPVAIAVADFDADGRSDVVTVDEASATLSFFYGRGDGTLELRQSFPGGASDPRSIAAMDLDADGHIDVATAFRAVEYQRETVWFIRGDGRRSYDIRAVYRPRSTQDGYGLLAGGEVTGDGIPDIVTARPGLTVIAGRPGQSPADPVNFEPANDGDFILLQDLDGDGKDEILLWHDNTIEFVSVGEGMRLEHFMTAAGPWPSGFAAGDIDGDGDVDVVLVSGGERRLTPLFNLLDPPLQPPSSHGLELEPIWDSGPGPLTIRYRASALDGSIGLFIYDVRGRKLHARRIDANTGSATWDRRDAAGALVHRGIYFVQLRSSVGTRQRKAILIHR